jgi:hypothetical protein
VKVTTLLLFNACNSRAILIFIPTSDSNRCDSTGTKMNNLPGAAFAASAPNAARSTVSFQQIDFSQRRFPRNLADHGNFDDFFP